MPTDRERERHQQREREREKEREKQWVEGIYSGFFCKALRDVRDVLNAI